MKKLLKSVKIWQSCIQMYTATVYIWMQLYQILTDFNNFFIAETGEKFTKQGMHLLIYYIKKVLLMT